jgi:transcriptional regulator with XRE-family HTH domain
LYQVVINLDAQKRIRQLMEERSWTEYRLSKESGLSQTTISSLFRRNNAPSLPTLEAVCRAFDISLSQFFAESTEPMELTDEQRTLFNSWVTLTKEQKKVLSDLIKTMR